MTDQVHSAIGEASPTKETFRTVHEILEEIARILELCAEGLERLVANPLITPRDSLMLATLAETRAQAAKNLNRVVNSWPRPGEDTWLQYAVVFSVRRNLLSRITAARGGQEAYEVLCESDDELERALDQMSLASTSSSQLLRQVKAVLVQLERSSRTIVESAQDI